MISPTRITQDREANRFSQNVVEGFWPKVLRLHNLEYGKPRVQTYNIVLI